MDMKAELKTKSLEYNATLTSLKTRTKQFRGMERRLKVSETKIQAIISMRMDASLNPSPLSINQENLPHYVTTEEATKATVRSRRPVSSVTTHETKVYQWAMHTFCNLIFDY